MPSRVFRNADDDFQVWLATHPNGFVVNTTARPSERYFVLHRASCTTLHRSVAPGGYTERDYVKACTSDETADSLELWIHESGGPGFTKLCAICKPPPPLSTKDPDVPSPAQFARQVEDARKLPRADRAKHLPATPSPATFYKTTSIVYARNPYVVAEVLERAAGFCESCRERAPFLRRSGGTPYLEVHHRVRLADGGDDTVDNSIAMCPNCHRKAHFGMIDE